jgi:hypothetical protein
MAAQCSEQQAKYAKKAVESGAPSPLEQLDEHLLACDTELGCQPACLLSQTGRLAPLSFAM